MEANDMTSGYLENLEMENLHEGVAYLVQVAPVNGMVTDDFNEDGNTDVLLVAMITGMRCCPDGMMAFTGLVLAGDERVSFKVIPSAHSGFYVGGDAKVCPGCRCEGRSFHRNTEPG